MSDLHQYFTSKENMDYILKNSIHNIINKGGPNYNHNDPKFFKIFNSIASAVYNYESKKYSNKPIQQTIKTLNDIIINEITKYVLNNNTINIHNTNNSNSNNSNNTNENNITNIHDINNINQKLNEKKNIINIKTKDENFKINLTEKEKNFTTPIENITNIKIIGFSTYNEDYIINEKNNKIDFSEKKENNHTEEIYSITIPIGNYTSEHDLLNKISHLMNEKSSNISVYSCILNEIDNTVTFKSKNNFKFIYNSNSILNILGFTDKQFTNNNLEKIYTSENPMRLIKKSNLNININFFDNDNIILNVKEPIILTNKKKEMIYYKINKDISLENINITKIVLDFGEYDTRGFPYNLLLQITRKINFLY